jgi:hypothetical protein
MAASPVEESCGKRFIMMRLVNLKGVQLIKPGDRQQSLTLGAGV